MSRAGSCNLILSISSFKVWWGHGEGLGDLRRNISLSCPPRSLNDMEKHSSKLNRAEVEAAEYPTAEAASSGRLRLEEVVAAVGTAPEVQDSGSCEVNWAPAFPGGPGWGQGGCSGQTVGVPSTTARNKRPPFFAELLWMAVGPANRGHSSERRPRVRIDQLLHPRERGPLNALGIGK